MENKEKIVIDIKGEVKNPRVYKMNQDDRIADAIEKAGGLTEEADTSNINLSKKVKDEMLININSSLSKESKEIIKEKKRKIIL